LKEGRGKAGEHTHFVEEKNGDLAKQDKYAPCIEGTEEFSLAMLTHKDAV
jgi:hypothetical protein